MAKVSKERTEAEAPRTCGRERCAPTSIDCAAAEGARSRSTHEWGSLVLGHAISMVSIGPQGHHDRPSRDSRTLASSRLPSVLAVEIPLSRRPTEDRWGTARADPPDERGKSAMGCTCVCRKPRPFDLVKESRNVGHDGRAALLPFETVGFAVQVDQPA
jgi:hypothetical protein